MNDSGPFPTAHRMGTGHPITAQAATIDDFPSVASYYSLGRRLHYSVLVKVGRIYVVEVRSNDVVGGLIERIHAWVCVRDFDQSKTLPPCCDF